MMKKLKLYDKPFWVRDMVLFLVLIITKLNLNYQLKIINLFLLYIFLMMEETHGKQSKNWLFNIVDILYNISSEISL